MSVYLIDPVSDPRWIDFLGTHPRASVFHSPAWLDALRRTYAYHPIVLTTSPPGIKLTSGLPICQVKTWGGQRFVSLDRKSVV